LRNVWILVGKDLRRDLKRPGALLVFMLLPLLSAFLMALVFGPKGDVQQNVVLQVAVLDRDDDMISQVLRSASGQADAAKHLQLHFVDSEEAGLALVEKRKVSAFVVLPERLTLDLLDGQPTKLQLYKNPAEGILPRVVDEGLQLVSLAVSGLLRLVQPELRQIRAMADGAGMPDAVEVAEVAGNTVGRLRTVEPYLFPPLVQMKTVRAAEYVPDATWVTNATVEAAP